MKICLLWFAFLSVFLLGGSDAMNLRRATNLKGGNVAGKTLGAVWPLPQQISQWQSYVSLDPLSFQFNYQGLACGIIDAAIARYQDIIFNPPRYAGCPNLKDNLDPNDYSGALPSISITLTGSQCEQQPYFSMDESYVLIVDTADFPEQAQLTANSTWGILRGLETFSQLIYHDDAKNFYANSSDINDFPRFPFRGFMLDTSRHYVTVGVIKQHLDAMAYNKFNVFHWHVTDDQSFPYQSQKFPSLSEEGSFNPKTHIYTFDDIDQVINYASQRGIRVIPEFDTPGHSLSWASIPDLLTPCYTLGVPNGDFGPIDPSKNSTYDFLANFFDEASRIYPDEYFHLGGDEVDFSCWASNPDIQAFMNQMGFGNNYTLLETYYMNRLIDIVSTMADSKDYIVWQEVFDNGGNLNANTVVNVWKDGYEIEMNDVTSKGFQAILSSCWYLNYISYGSDWVDYYRCEPFSFGGSDTQQALVMGGSGCMWGEYVDGTNLVQRTWPRASAISERLWSAQSVTSSTDAAPRLEEHRCKLLERGINAEPFNGPNYCWSDYLIE